MRRVPLSSIVKIFITVTSLPKASALYEMPCGVEMFRWCCRVVHVNGWNSAAFPLSNQSLDGSFLFKYITRLKKLFVVRISGWVDEASSVRWFCRAFAAAGEAEGYIGLCAGWLTFSTADSSGQLRTQTLEVLTPQLYCCQSPPSTPISEVTNEQSEAGRKSKSSSAMKTGETFCVTCFTGTVPPF